ncbi:hypothetical protein [uncultured Vagococcus sp.]|uniref:hypothetical protein n=1 Tax=uncultured Vagococcus sp. TaxID=189676 RepID=UPI0028D4420E|nr:hypothetical protein [uncultured Vagococcus sp.]
MEILDMVMLTGLSLGILFFFLILVTIVSRVFTGKKMKEAERLKPKRRTRIRKWRRDLQRLAELKSKQGKRLIFLIVLMVISVSMAGYSKFYQLTNMTAGDSETIVTGYYLLDKAAEQINERLAGKIDGIKLNENIHNLSIRMASYAAKRANNSASTEGQQQLNRYYAQVGQLGVNLASEQFLDDESGVESLSNFLEDIDNAQKTQKQVLNFYKVDETSLKEKK